MDMTRVQYAKETAAQWHKSVNQEWGDLDSADTCEKLPYHFHTNLSLRVALKYITLVPESNRETVLMAMPLHDTIEDARKTYNDVKNKFGTKVADLVYALTNEKGKIRKERANAKYYHDLNKVKFGPFMKLCDRIANVLGGLITKGKVSDMAIKELDDFVGQLETEGYEDMVYDLKFLVQTGIFNFTPIDKIKEPKIDEV